MKESDYILATNLARFRDAYAILSAAYPLESGDNALVEILKRLRSIIDPLEAKIDETVVGDE